MFVGLVGASFGSCGCASDESGRTKKMITDYPFSRTKRLSTRCPCRACIARSSKHYIFSQVYIIRVRTSRVKTKGNVRSSMDVQLIIFASVIFSLRESIAKIVSK